MDEEHPRRRLSDAPEIVDRVDQRKQYRRAGPSTVHGWQVMCLDARWYAARSFGTEQEAERFAARMAGKECGG